MLKSAFKSYELEQHLKDVIAVDDKCAVEDMSTELVLKEAQYVLDKFVGNTGFDQASDYCGDNGPEAKKLALAEVAALRKFLKKYRPPPTAAN